MTRVHERRRIFALLDGRLPARAEQSLERHLDGCEACRQYLETVKSGRRALATVGRESAALDWERVRLSQILREARRQEAMRVPWLRWSLGAALAGAAAVVLLVVGGRALIADERFTPRANDPVAIGRTLTDTLPGQGLVTLVGDGAQWRLPGLGWQRTDLHTLVSEGMQLRTAGGEACVQVASLSGVRIEARSYVSFRKLTREAVHIDLAQGTVAVDIDSTGPLGDVTISTAQARVRVDGTLLSVSQQGGSTRIVVARGKASLTPRRQGAKAVILTAPSVVEVDVSGRIRGVRGDGTLDAVAKARVEDLLGLLFNTFEGDPAQVSVAFVPDGEGSEARVVVEGKLAGSTPLAMLAPSGAGSAMLQFEGGTAILASFDALKGTSTEVTFQAPFLQSKPVPFSAQKPSSKKASETGVKAPEGSLEGMDHPPEIEGFLPSDVVKLVMKNKHAALRVCYEKWLAASNPEQTIVKARLRFTVEQDGKVSAASATSSASDGKLESCLSTVTSSIVFPPPSGGIVEFEYPITFAPK